VSLLHVSVTLLFLHLLSLDLNLVSLSILLLAGELTLNGFQIEELSTQLESEWELLLKHLSILFKVANVTLLESTDGLLVLSLHLCEGLVPTLVEILIFHQVSLLDFLALSGLVKDQLLTTTIEVLNL